MTIDTTPTLDDAELTRRMKVNVPEGRSGNLQIRQFLVGDHSDDLASIIRYGPDRLTRPGRYTKLIEWDGDHELVWMSDSDAETRDHLPVMRAAADPDVRSVLVNGLGLGVVLSGLATLDHLERIDVVEANPDVIALVAPTFAGDERIAIHHDDAYGIRWPKGARWDVAWHDIWPHIAADNLTGMWRLVQKYRDRADWQGLWVFDLCLGEWHKEDGLLDEIAKLDGAEPGPGHPAYEVYKDHQAERRAWISILANAPEVMDQ